MKVGDKVKLNKSDIHISGWWTDNIPEELILHGDTELDGNLGEVMYITKQNFAVVKFNTKGTSSRGDNIVQLGYKMEDLDLVEELYVPQNLDISKELFELDQQLNKLTGKENQLSGSDKAKWEILNAIMHE